MASYTRIAVLSKQISDNSEILNKYLTEQNLNVSFEVDAIDSFPNDAPFEVLEARRVVIEATRELNILVTGPAEHMRWLSTVHHDVSSLRYIYHYKLAEHVPLEGSISYSELGQKAGVDELQCKRVIRHAMTNHIFQEPKSGSVAHTSNSAVLGKKTNVRDWVGFCVDESARISSKLVEATKQNRNDRWAYQLAFDTELTMFEHMAHFPERAERFANVMVDMTTSDGYHIRHLVNGFAWDELPEGSTIVDVGGSTGHASKAIAERVPHLKFVVQDLADVIGQGKELIKQEPESIQSRFSFQVHDFFTPEPVRNAAVYLLRFILHDHPDNASIKILQNLASAMSPGDRIVVMDGVSPEPGAVPPSVERTIRIMDMEMLAGFNSSERERDQWEVLFTAADSRLKLKNIVQPQGSAQVVMEVVLE